MAGKSFLKLGQTGIGTQTTTERTAGVSTATGTVTFDVTDSKAKVYNGTAWIDLSTSFSATGGNSTLNHNNKKIHVFTSPGDFVVEGDGTIEYVMIGGGGGGGAGNAGFGSGGGGGAGGYITNSGPISAGTYPVVIGPGGTGTNGVSSDATGTGGNGTPTTFNGLTAYGGGGGGGGSENAAPGGSGGGASPVPTSQVGGTGDRQTGTSNSIPADDGSPQGNPGGDSYPCCSGAGGGGAGGAGSGSPVGHGGAGVRLPTTFRVPTSPYGDPGPGGTNHWVAGGGGVGGHPGTPTPGDGGGPGGPFAGAGDGGVAGGDADAAVANSGSGGGGGGENPGSFDGGNGGSGLVLIAYDN